jgi:hypothetical protein
MNGFRPANREPMIVATRPTEGTAAEAGMSAAAVEYLGKPWHGWVEQGVHEALCVPRGASSASGRPVAERNERNDPINDVNLVVDAVTADVAD